MLNFDIDPAVLAPLVPEGTELDDWQGRTLLSMVGFRFLNTRVLGMAIPFHRNFEEVNLRFYVRRRTEEGWRRAVVFIKELVPRLAIAIVARTVYGENYVAVPMRHRIEGYDEDAQSVRSVSYGWRFKGQENQMRVIVAGEAHEIEPGGAEEFITEHYWGYAGRRGQRTLEYQVEHPRWRVWTARDVQFHCDAARLYGPQFAECLQAPSHSAFLADGSEVTVCKGAPLPM